MSACPPAAGKSRRGVCPHGASPPPARGPTRAGRAEGREWCADGKGQTTPVLFTEDTKVYLEKPNDSVNRVARTDMRVC